MRVKNRERPSTWVRLYLYQTVLGQGSFSQMELFSSIWRKHSTDSLRVALFFMLKDSKILGSIPRSCQALYVKILQSRNSLPKIKGIFQRCIPIRPPEQTKKTMLDPQKKPPFIRMRASKCLVNSPASLWPCRRDSFVPCGCRKERIWRPCRGSRWRWSPRDVGS